MESNANLSHLQGHVFLLQDTAFRVEANIIVSQDMSSAVFLEDRKTL